MNTNEYFTSKPRYEILDGLRGIAALLMIAYHAFESYIPHIGTQIINHGYLAVDFFFILSGFVVGYAYDDRWDRMNTWSFCKRRLVRLHPMVVAGAVIGASLYFLGSCGGSPMIMQAPFWKFALCFLLSLLMIPNPPSLDIRGWMEINNFNAPNWSLTYEYIANVLYALVFRHLPTFALVILCGLSTVLTLDITLGWDIFGFFPEGTHYNLIGGWSSTPSHIYLGFTRLLFPFLCGLIISRVLAKKRSETNPSGSPFHLNGGFWWMALLLAAIFSVPCLTGEEGVINGLYQAICVIVIFPLIVLIGAGSRTTDTVSLKICQTIGKLSYPLYITHYPVMYIQMAWIYNNPDAQLWQHIVMNIGIIVFSIILAWCVYKTYDVPVRKWLIRNWLKKNNMIIRDYPSDCKFCARTQADMRLMPASACRTAVLRRTSC